MSQNETKESDASELEWFNGCGAMKLALVAAILYPHDAWADGGYIPPSSLAYGAVVALVCGMVYGWFVMLFVWAGLNGRNPSAYPLPPAHVQLRGASISGVIVGASVWLLGSITNQDWWQSIGRFLGSDLDFVFDWSLVVVTCLVLPACAACYVQKRFWDAHRAPRADTD